MYFHMGLLAAVVVVDFDSGFVDVFVFVFFFFFFLCCVVVAKVEWWL